MRTPVPIYISVVTNLGFPPLLVLCDGPQQLQGLPLHLQTLLSIVAHEDLALHQIDIVSAYLQSDLDEEIYMLVPEGIQVEGKEGWYWKLKKAIYGLKQAGQQWKTKLNNAMETLGFIRSQADYCLYIL